MSVLIRGMKMPESCITCPLCECRNECAYCEVGDKYLSWDWDERLRSSRNDHCPLTEVPPHGRLIDADKINYEDEIWKKKCIPPQVVYNAWVVCGEMPTFIEEESGT